MSSVSKNGVIRLRRHHILIFVSLIFLSTSIIVLLLSNKETTRLLSSRLLRSLTTPKSTKETTTKPKIPPTIFFTYSHNILTTKEPAILYKNIQNTIQKYKEAFRAIDGYEKEPKVEFLTDSKCRYLINLVYPEILLDFNNEGRGEYKADICRVAALLVHGGYYFDVDIEVVHTFIPPPNVSFSTVYGPLKEEFFQAFMAVEAGHPILRRALQFMKRYYQGTLKATLLGPRTLKMAHDVIVAAKKVGVEDVVLLDEIWMDVPFWKRKYPLFPQQKGYGCCCNYVVHDPTREVIHFYSRIIDYHPRRCRSTPLI